ncbi:ATPase [Cladophialophora psammophila CBS 110553]|uniref:ATPase n=1 Tax=Cladophialophora psammophila CBS 110553 TaxID=1182543 RepID=W9X349_9EURO|nr:ATPase [Cladophialophora psammophila CBS 110553]EXJ74638.1 ATPase [Cladophialophora psammophila CBS 110553]
MDAEARNSSARDNQFFENAMRQPRTVQASETINQEQPDDIIAHQGLCSYSGENLPLSIEPDMISRLSTLSQAEIDFSRLDATDANFDFHKWASETLSKADKSKFKYRRASVAFLDLDVFGSTSVGRPTQATVASVLGFIKNLRHYFNIGRHLERKILSSFDGLIKHGEMLLVLGRPGSGCSTLLKTIAGEMGGLKVGPYSYLRYNGLPQGRMVSQFKGEMVYNAEVDHHFPHLTVKQTLEFAATVRTPSNRIIAASRKENIRRLTSIVMAICGLTHTRNTKVGNDYIRGVSGGERKRVSIAETMLAWSPIGCWDNSTRGLDSATALEFVRTLKVSSDLLGTSHVVAIYQASQAIYDIFDKVIVLYEGREIYFGSTTNAKAYFEEMGWYCPQRQTTGDFLTAITNHRERKPRAGYELSAPRTAQEFENYWRQSPEFKRLQDELDAYRRDPSNQVFAEELQVSHKAAQSKWIRAQSPYMVNFAMQVQVCTKRAYQRLWNDKPSTLTVVIGQVIMALVVGSVFYGTPNTTASFFARGSTLFFATLLSALIAVTEINALYQQRPIVEKHVSYAFCRPASEALAGVICDAPVKIVIAILFNIILYFLAGLSSTASQFFIFFLFTTLVRFTMSAMFRTLAAATRKASQALALAGILVLIIVIYTGYTIPRPYMRPWFKWLTWINPLSYAFEALMVNEFHGREFPCANLVPAYPNQSGTTFVCSVPGSIAGQATVSGDAYVQASFQYNYSHLWRNFGIGISFYVFFLITYLVATELNSATSGTAEVLHFISGNRKASVSSSLEQDTSEEQPSLKGNYQQGNPAVPQQRDVFSWGSICYDVSIKDEPRRLLDNVCGWVKPGTLTALMGVSGAGKTTLLDVLAQRTSTGIITGDMLVNGAPIDRSFQRKSGYVQQQDVHLATSTVREALRFSAALRQTRSVSLHDKYSHVEDVIKMLDMEEFADAVIGAPGEGLNVEQRKLLTIGVELAAKPALLLFLDEPTSGLDSQSSWAIVCLLRKLANYGQAILCTIHQPSSILFEKFDKLLFLAKGGKTVYFGDIGPNSEILLRYFESRGARPCLQTENPAEYILETVSAASGKPYQDWPELWKSSQEYRAVVEELDRIHLVGSSATAGNEEQDEFAMPLLTQIKLTTIRVFQQYWRTPSYIWGKTSLGLVSALFIGFSFFQSNSSLQGMQNTIFSVFMLASILNPLVQQIMPRFVMQRSLYEVRERPSKIYSWVAFVMANIAVETVYQVLLGILVFACYYYPVFGVQSSQRQGLMLLYCVETFVFASTFAHMIIAALPDTQTAAALATLLFSMTMIFNGVFQPPQALPGFWIFMYRVSPLTYIIGGFAATGLHGKHVQCSSAEMNVFNPPSGQTCGQYLKVYMATASGEVYNPSATVDCQYCPLTTSDQFLALSSISWGTRWRNFGIIWAYVCFNVILTMAFYYAFRVKKWDFTHRKKRWSRLGTWATIAGRITKTLVLGAVGRIIYW